MTHQGTTMKWLTSSDALTEADFTDAERFVYNEGDCIHQMAARLLFEVRRLKHELDDPMYKYAGTRISRGAIACREATIANLIKKKIGSGDIK